MFKIPIFKINFYMLVLGGCLISTGSEAIADRISSEVHKDQYYFIMDNEVNLRKTPGFKTAIIAAIDSGEICRYEYEIGDWILVNFSDNRKGFIHKSLLAPYIPLTEPPRPFSLVASIRAAGRTESGESFGTAEHIMPFEGGYTLFGIRWSIIALFSIGLNLVVFILLAKHRLSLMKSANSYDELKELAGVEKSKDSLKRELRLSSQYNRRLEKTISDLRAQLETNRSYSN